MGTYAAAVLNALSGIPSEELIVFFISMMPVLELRGGLLAASWLEIELWRAVLVCVAGCFLPVPFILLLIRRILRAMKRIRLTREIAVRLEQRALGKSENIRRFEFWGLLIFVGIPLPGTGAWTGALIAALLDIPPKKAALAILAGILLSAALMTALAYGILGSL